MAEEKLPNSAHSKNTLSVPTHVSLVSASGSQPPFLVGVRAPLELLSSLGDTVNSKKATGLEADG